MVTLKNFLLFKWVLIGCWIVGSILNKPANKLLIEKPEVLLNHNTFHLFLEHIFRKDEILSFSPLIIFVKCSVAGRLITFLTNHIITSLALTFIYILMF